MKQKLLSVLGTCLPAWLFIYLSVNYFLVYAFGLFIWLPIVMGACSTVIYGYRNPITRSMMRNNAYLTLLVFGIGLLLFAWEGVICLIMVAPLALAGTYVGYLVGISFVKNGSEQSRQAMVILLLLSVPAVMAFEQSVPEDATVRQVVTRIEIAASPDEVWKNVIAFPTLPEPKEWLFRTGIAYPVNATITGQGVGATRKCNFTTGCFVEPITIWSPAELLGFDVKEQPDPMKEISPYEIRPNHLNGYWVSKKGQFKLTPLANGHTLLEGTTWYVNRIKPAFYWTLWSDYIVHKIHLRVLSHIKRQSEAA